MQETLDDDITLLDYWNIILRRKRMITILVTVTFIASVSVNLLLPKYYKSETVLMATASDSGGLGAALSSIPLAGALAGAAGIQTPADKIMVFLKSRTIAEAVIKKLNLLQVFNEGDWDAAQGKWKDPDNPPLMEEAVKKLNEDVSDFVIKKKEGTITLTVEWKDPKLAAEIANYYVAALNQFMNEKAVNMTIQVVDRAVPAEKKCRPKRTLNVITSSLVSLFIGLFIAVFQEHLSKQKQLSSAANKAGNGNGQTSSGQEVDVLKNRSDVLR